MSASAERKKIVMNNVDFIAKLYFLPTQKGGRKSYAKSGGYIPQIEFDNYPEMSTSGKQTYLDTDIVLPGEKVKAQIEIFSVGFFSKRLYKGMNFKFLEGKQLIGKGEILEILNEDLLLETTEERININLYPIDITNKIKLDLGVDAFKIVRELQELIKLNKTYQNPRLIRAIIFLIIHKKQKRKVLYEEVKKDLKNILYSSEYEYNKKIKQNIRVRNFNNIFGKETI